MNVNKSMLLCLLSIAPAPAFARHPYPVLALGTLTVHNDTSTTLSVSVEGRRLNLPPQGVGAVSLPAGPATIQASYELYGRSFSLPAETAQVEAHRSSWVELDAPRTALVEVRNEWNRPGTVLVDGRNARSVAAYESAYLSLSAGSHELRFAVDGRTVDSQRLYAQPLREQRFVAEAPRQADLRVSNPHPAALVVSVDQQTRTLPAYGQAVFTRVDVGSERVSARRLSGELVDSETVRIDPFGANLWTIDAPRTGLVEVDYDGASPATLLEQGRVLASLAPGQDTRLSLPVGWHELEIRDAYGRRLEKEWVEVEAFELARIDADRRDRLSRHDGHEGHHDHGDRDRAKVERASYREDEDDDGRGRSRSEATEAEDEEVLAQGGASCDMPR